VAKVDKNQDFTDYRGHNVRFRRSDQNPRKTTANPSTSKPEAESTREDGEKISRKSSLGKSFKLLVSRVSNLAVNDDLLQNIKDLFLDPSLKRSLVAYVVIVNKFCEK
jgi:hypothetical protein